MLDLRFVDSAIEEFGLWPVPDLLLSDAFLATCQGFNTSGLAFGDIFAEPRFSTAAGLLLFVCIGFLAVWIVCLSLFDGWLAVGVFMVRGLFTELCTFAVLEIGGLVTRAADDCELLGGMPTGCIGFLATLLVLAAGLFKVELSF